MRLFESKARSFLVYGQLFVVFVYRKRTVGGQQ